MTKHQNKLPARRPLQGSARVTSGVGGPLTSSAVNTARPGHTEGTMPRNNALTRRLAELERQRAVLLEVAQLVIDTATIETPDKLLKAATLAIRIAEVLP